MAAETLPTAPPHTEPVAPDSVESGERAGEAARAERGAEKAENWLLLSALVLLGGISGIAYYLGFVRPYLLEDYYLKPLQDLAKINGATNGAANSWAFTWIVLGACYYFAFRLCPSIGGVSRAYRWAALGIVGGWAGVFCANLLFMYPVGAADLFDQVFRARLTSVYGLNPFTTLPLSIEGDPFRPFVAWQGDPSPYGPMWELLAAGTSWLANTISGPNAPISVSLWNNLLLFKLLTIAAYAGSAVLVYATLRAWKPEWALRGLIFFAWNPLVLFEIAGNGHNDAFVAFFLLLAVYLFVTVRYWAMLPALMLGALTKFVPILLVPAAIAAIWRAGRSEYRVPSSEHQVQSEDVQPRGTWYSLLGTRLQALALGTGLSVGLAIMLYGPFWTGLQSVGALGRQTLFTASIPKVILDWLTLNMGIETTLAQGIVRWSALALAGISSLAIALWVLLSQNAKRKTQNSLKAFYEIIFVYLACATLWFQPWYLLWLVALAAPLASITHANRALLFCVGGVLNYFVWDFIWLWNRSPFREIQITSALVVYTLPLLYTMYVLLRGRGAMDNE